MREPDAILDSGNIRLYCGDCLEILPTLEAGSVDAVVTDPPYGINGGSGTDARLNKKGDYSDVFDDTEEYVSKVVVIAIDVCTKLARAVVLTPGNRCLHLYPKASDVGCFWTPASSTHGRWGFTTFQPILYYGKDWRAGRGALPSGRQVTERAEKNGHPCPKPIGAWTWLVDKAAPATSSILDPFMGSGTTGVACVKTGRKFIGIELDRGYFDIAVKRIEKALKERDEMLVLAK